MFLNSVNLYTLVPLRSLVFEFGLHKRSIPTWPSGDAGLGEAFVDVSLCDILNCTCTTGVP